MELFYAHIEANYHLVTDLAKLITESEYVCIYGSGPGVSVASYVSNKISAKIKKPVTVISGRNAMEAEVFKPNHKHLLIVLTASLRSLAAVDYIKYVEASGDNYNITSLKGIRLIDKQLYYEPDMLRDRLLYFTYFELVLNELDKY